MEPPRKHKSNGVPVKEQVESEDGNEKDLPGKRRRTEVSGSIAQLQQLIEVFDKNKVQDDLPLEDSTGKDPMDVVQNSGEANGRSNKTALSRLQNLCKAIGWKEPSYDFEEQGPEHMKIFKCKLTVHLDGVLNTFMECFSDPRPTKKAAIEHAAQGLLWILKRSGYIN